MQLLCLKFVTLTLALRLNFAWASQFAWSVLVIWVGGLIASLITWVLVLYTPRKCMSFCFSFTAGFFFFFSLVPGFFNNYDFIFFFFFFYKYRNFIFFFFFL